MLYINSVLLQHKKNHKINPKICNMHFICEKYKLNMIKQLNGNKIHKL